MTPSKPSSGQLGGVDLPEGQFLSPHTLFSVVYFSEGACSNPVGDKAETNMSLGKEYKTRMEAGPCLFLLFPIMGGRVTPRPYNLDLVWLQEEGSFLLFYLHPDFTRTDRQEGAFQTQEGCPLPCLSLCLVVVGPAEPQLGLPGAVFMPD